MALYTISDLHLSFGTEKPMDIFGGNWQGYDKKIEQNLNSILTDNDTLIIGGDLSWGISLEESLADFEFLNKLPGKKILLKGNHDLWWESITKMNHFLEKNNINNISFLFNNFFVYNNIAICGSRGWLFRENFKDIINDEKIYKRELLRLNQSLTLAKDYKEKIVIMHYPIIYQGFTATDFIDLLKSHNVSRVVYGHLHGNSLNFAISGNHYDIEFILASADYLNFYPILLEK